jgi:hypothetical protein
MLIGSSRMPLRSECKRPPTNLLFSARTSAPEGYPAPRALPNPTHSSTAQRPSVLREVFIYVPKNEKFSFYEPNRIHNVQYLTFQIPLIRLVGPLLAGIGASSSEKIHRSHQFWAWNISLTCHKGWTFVELHARHEIISYHSIARLIPRVSKVSTYQGSSRYPSHGIAQLLSRASQGRLW